VAIKNEVVALFEAPARRSPMAAGMTPQEHKGKGAPIKAAFTVVLGLLLPRCFASQRLGSPNLMVAAITKPINSQGAALKNKANKLFHNII
jgi:hypothetical protein